MTRSPPRRPSSAQTAIHAASTSAEAASAARRSSRKRITHSRSGSGPLTVSRPFPFERVAHAPKPADGRPLVVDDGLEQRPGLGIALRPANELAERRVLARGQTPEEERQLRAVRDARIGDHAAQGGELAARPRTGNTAERAQGRRGRAGGSRWAAGRARRAAPRSRTRRGGAARDPPPPPPAAPPGAGRRPAWRPRPSTPTGPCARAPDGGS